MITPFPNSKNTKAFTGCHPVKAFYAVYGAACGGKKPYNRPGALWGLRVLKFDGAIAPRVLRFDAPPARGLWWHL